MAMSSKPTSGSRHSRSQPSVVSATRDVFTPALATTYNVMGLSVWAKHGEVRPRVRMARVFCRVT
jgi:hypothetical protein